MGRYFFMSEDEWDLFDKDVKTIKEAGERIVYNIRDSLVLGGTRATLVEDLKAELREKTIQLADARSINQTLIAELLEINTGITKQSIDFNAAHTKLTSGVTAVYRLKDKLAAVESENAELRKLTAILPDFIAIKKINDDLSDLKVNLSITEEMRDAVTVRLAVAVADFKSLEVELAEANVTIKQQAHKLVEIKTLVK